MSEKTEERQRRHLRIEWPIFGQVTEAFGSSNPVGGNVQSGDARGASAGGQVAGEDLHRSGFSCAIGAKKRHHLSSRDGESYIPDSSEVPIELTEADRLDHGRRIRDFHGRNG